MPAISHPRWVPDLDAALAPLQQAILNTPVIEHASENRLREPRIPDSLVAFYPIVRDFPRWLELLLNRSPDDGRGFFEENIRVERRHGAAVSATNYAVEGIAQKISEKALRGLSKNDKIGPKGRWWLEEHAKYDDEHPIQALEIVKRCVARGESAAAVTNAAVRSLSLMKEAMVAAYAV